MPAVLAGTVSQQVGITALSLMKLALTFSSPIFYTMACALNLFEQFDFELTLKQNV